ncbi:MAG: hypothetical protein NT090_25010 [Acidobacteria bacterium]|nr:hypothetical protein [Acidobacteriota bacterium]
MATKCWRDAPVSAVFGSLKYARCGEIDRSVSGVALFVVAITFLAQGS